MKPPRVSLLLLACLSLAWGKPVFFIVAHQDDWQLFMGDNAFVDIQSGEDAVLIYVTAGAKERATGTGTAPFFHARELAANQSVILAAGAGNNAPPGSGEWSKVSINGHDIACWSYGSTTSYYLRLPDGSGSGAGYEATGWQSLVRFYRGEVPTYDAVDGSTSYLSWSDLVETVAGIMQQHAGEQRHFWVNLQDPDRDLNVADHSDHTHAGILAREAVARAGAGREALWLGHREYGSEPPPAGRFSKSRSLWGAQRDPHRPRLSHHLGPQPPALAR